MKRPHPSSSSSSSPAIRKKDPVVFLDPAYPTYRGYVPPPTATARRRERHHDEDDTTTTDGDHSRSSSPPSSLDRVDAQLITPQAFFESYVSPRKPCLLHNVLSLSLPIDANDGPSTESAGMKEASAARLLLHALGAQLKDTTFQLEVRESDRDAFGQNRSAQRQVEMTFGELLDKVPHSEKSLYYLSTQQPKRERNSADDDDDDDAYDPCRSSLVDALEALPTHPAIGQALQRLRQLAGHLVLDSKHGWLGFASAAAATANSDDGADPPLAADPPPTTVLSWSGLHHDFHDNFNAQIVGSKDWTLYPPVDYPRIPLYGTVHGLHGVNGLICYRDSVTRADGVPLALLLPPDDDDDDDDSKGERCDTTAFGLAEGEDRGSDEDEADGSDGGGDDHVGKKPPNEAAGDDDSISDPGEGRASLDLQGDPSRRDEAGRRPNSFSPVDMTLPPEERARRFPDFGPRHEVTVRVRAGEALYLPASWFHSVASFADATASVPGDAEATSTSSYPLYHLAVNYWYHPPDQDSYQQPYRNAYWATHAKKEQGK